MTTQEIKEQLIKAGVRNLIEFGYPEVNAENIMTDIVYCGFFQAMLVENKGNGKSIDVAIGELLNEIKTLT